VDLVVKHILFLGNQFYKHLDWKNNQKGDLLKILFVLNNTYKSNDANFNLASIIMLRLAEAGHKVISLGNTEYSDAPLSETKNGIKFERFIFKERNSYIIFQRKFSKLKQGRWSKLFSLLFHPFILFSALEFHLYSKNELRRKYVKSIENLVSREKIDIVISVSNPYITAIATARSKITCKKIAYQLDPHANNKNALLNYKKRLMDEEYVYNNVDKVLVTDLIFNENILCSLSRHLGKMEQMSFPNIRMLKPNEEYADIDFDRNFVNCVFVGYFYEDIRNPSFMLEIFKKLINTNIILHIIGGGTDDILEKYQNLLGKHLVLYGKVTLERAMNFMTKADILVNLGNSVSNQMPSKIFDYISTGKPIINIYKIDNCPTLKFTSIYPLCLDIRETNGLDLETIKKIEEFCIKNCGKLISFELIEQLYFNYTPESFTNRFLAIIDRI